METNEQTTLQPVNKLPLSSLSLYRNPRTDLGDIPLLVQQIITAEKIIEPLKGFVKDRVFNVVEGKRRFTALTQLAEMGGYDEIVNNVPVELIEDTSDVAISFLQLLSFERKDLTPLELAEEIKRLSETFGVSTEEISHRLKVSTVYVNQLKRLADVPESVKQAIRDGVVTATQVRDAMKAGKLEELIKLIEALQNGEDEKEGSEVVGEEKPKVTVKKPNSLRDFRQFRKVHSRIFPNKAAQEKFELLEALADDELTVKNYEAMFTVPPKQTTSKKAPVEAEKPKEAPKKAVAAPKKAVAPKKAKEAAKGAENANKAAPKKAAPAKKVENKD